MNATIRLLLGVLALALGLERFGLPRGGQVGLGLGTPVPRVVDHQCGGGLVDNFRPGAGNGDESTAQCGVVYSTNRQTQYNLKGTCYET